jgi:hypothetical protein
MSVEVDSGRWRYANEEEENEASDDDREQAAPIPERPPFTSTPLHDLEPLFWMIIWTLVVRYLNPNTRYQWQVDYYHQIFHAEGKRGFITNPGYDIPDFINVASAGHDVLRRLKRPLKAMASLLTGSFTKLEKKFPYQLDRSAHADNAAPNLMVNYIRQLCKALGDDQLPLYPEPRTLIDSAPPETPPKKRAHSEMQASTRQQADRKVKKPRNEQRDAD